jgi:hypothetical protein
MLRQSIVSAAILSTTIVPSLALSIVLSAFSASARSTVITHNLDVDSVATCSVIASKQKNWILTDAIPTKSGARCFFSEVVETQSWQIWTPSQQIGKATWSIGASSR